MSLSTFLSASASTLTRKELQSALKDIRTNPSEYGIYDQDFLVYFDQLRFSASTVLLRDYLEQAQSASDTFQEMEDEADAAVAEFESRDRSEDAKLSTAIAEFKAQARELAADLGVDYDACMSAEDSYTSELDGDTELPATSNAERQVAQFHQLTVTTVTAAINRFFAVVYFTVALGAAFFRWQRQSWVDFNQHVPAGAAILTVIVWASNTVKMPSLQLPALRPATANEVLESMVTIAVGV